MTTVQHRRTFDAPPSDCPICGLRGLGFIHREGRVRTGHYICPIEHIWTQRWADLVD
jgi:hypothetical protein